MALDTVVVRGGAWRVPPGGRYGYARPVPYGGYRAPTNINAPSRNVNINNSTNVNINNSGNRGSTARPATQTAARASTAQNRSAASATPSTRGYSSPSASSSARNRYELQRTFRIPEQQLSPFCKLPRPTERRRRRPSVMKGTNMKFIYRPFSLLVALGVVFGCARKEAVPGSNDIYDSGGCGRCTCRCPEGERQCSALQYSGI